MIQPGLVYNLTVKCFAYRPPCFNSYFTCLITQSWKLFPTSVTSSMWFLLPTTSSSRRWVFPGWMMQYSFVIARRLAHREEAWEADRLFRLFREKKKSPTCCLHPSLPYPQTPKCQPHANSKQDSFCCQLSSAQLPALGHSKKETAHRVGSIFLFSEWLLHFQKPSQSA